MLMILFAATDSGIIIQAANKNLGDMKSDVNYSWEKLPKTIETNIEHLPDPNLVKRNFKLCKPKFNNYIKKTGDSKHCDDILYYR